jgi:hypothetical protein
MPIRLAPLFLFLLALAGASAQNSPTPVLTESKGVQPSSAADVLSPGLSEVFTLYRSGKFEDAAAKYRQLLATDSKNPDA